MAQLFANNASTILANSITANDLSMTVAQSASFPTLSDGDYFYLTLYAIDGVEEVSHEVVKCTAVAGNILTVVRGQESTTARSWGTGTAVELRLTAGTLNNFIQLDSPPATLDVGTSTLVRLGSGTIDVFSNDNPTPNLEFRNQGTACGGFTAAGAFVVGAPASAYSWGASYPNMQVNTAALVGFVTSGIPNTFLTNNCYFDGVSWKYCTTGSAMMLSLNNTMVSLKYVPSGNAGATISLWSSIYDWMYSSRLGGYAMTFNDWVNVPSSKGYLVNQIRVVGPRQTGWTAATGTESKGAFVVSTATVAQCAARIKALEDALRAHGLID